MAAIRYIFTFMLLVLLSQVDQTLSYVPVQCPQVDLNQRIHPCTREYNPMCGTDGRTYPNSCTYCAERWTNARQGRTWNVVVDYEGICATPASPTPSSAPVPVINPFQRYNGESFTSALWRFLNRGNASPYRQQLQQTFSRRRANCGPFGPMCSRYGMVCGSDGTTYNTECDACFRAQRSGTTIDIVKDGYC